MGEGGYGLGGSDYGDGTHGRVCQCVHARERMRKGREEVVMGKDGKDLRNLSMTDSNNGRWAMSVRCGSLVRPRRCEWTCDA